MQHPYLRVHPGADPVRGELLFVSNLFSFLQNWCASETDDIFRELHRLAKQIRMVLDGDVCGRCENGDDGEVNTEHVEMCLKRLRSNIDLSNLLVQKLDETDLKTVGCVSDRGWYVTERQRLDEETEKGRLIVPALDAYLSVGAADPWSVDVHMEVWRERNKDRAHRACPAADRQISKWIETQSGQR